ncbi:MAG TPA: hypothetical protein VMW30_10190 [Candidatus Paceibacterota bacterium]|nr:hypothetical protein [Candidatus Paceibacterota bacterium]
MSLLRRVFITVKTYPTLSKKYDELVCTAGILDDGNWVRIYPLPFRKLENDNRYKKYQWMELLLEKNSGDPRPESYRPVDPSKIRLIGSPVGTEDGWAKRKQIIFDKNPIYTDLAKTISKAQRDELSIAIFKPTEILEFLVQDTDRECKKDRLELLEAKASQLQIFQTEEEVRREFSIVRKLPYKFSYRFRDAAGKVSTLMIEDWEIGALYWNCLDRSGGDESKALELVRQKYLNEFVTKDLFLFLGTTRQYHSWAKNPFIIIGVFYPPISLQDSLF